MKQKVLKYAKVAWFASFLGVLCYICMHFFPHGDDLVFADWFLNHKMSPAEMLTVYGVNGRYLGNVIGIVMSALGKTSFWWVRNLFHFLVLTGLFLLLSLLMHLCFKRDFTLCSVPVGVLFGTLSVQMWNGVLSNSACFVNYVVPILFLGLIGILLVYQSNGKIIPFHATLIGACAFLGSLFSEHTTFYMLACAIALLVWSCICHRPVRKTQLAFLIGSVLGTVAMFCYPLVYPENSAEGYRKISSITELPQFIWNNVLDKTDELLWFHYLPGLFLSGIACLLLLSLCCQLFLQKQKSKSTVCKIVAIFGTIFVLGVSCVRFVFCNFGDWRNTSFQVIVSDVFGVILTILWLVAMGVTIWLFFDQIACKVLLLWCYFSVWLCCGMLSVVSPIGGRHFFIIYVFLVVIGTIFFFLSLRILQKTLLRLFFVGSILLFSIYFCYIANAYQEAFCVQNQRFAYIEAEIKKGATTVRLPESVNFADWQHLAWFNRCFYHSQPEDVTIVIVDYDAWLAETEN